MERLLALRPDEPVPEIGYGNGSHARHMTKQGARVLGTDFSKVYEVT